MRILLIVLSFFVLHSFVSAQYLFNPFKGEKKIMKLKAIEIGIMEWAKKNPRYKFCGDYFWYEEYGENGKVINFRPTLARNDGENYEPASMLEFWERKKNVAIQLDDNAKVPTARWHLSYGSYTMIIRISNKDYKEAKCLPEPKKSYLLDF